MAVIEIKNDELKVGVSETGAELMYITAFDGTEYLWNGEKSVWSYRAPILFPICGGLKDDKFVYSDKEYTLGKHGFARNMEFNGVRISDTKAEFVLVHSAETLKSYPFEFKFKVVYELFENKLNVEYITENLSENEMYFSVGAHEGYYCPEGIEEYQVEFDKEQTLDSYILNGNLLENNKIRIVENSKNLPLKYDYFKVDALVFKNIDFNKAYLVHKNGKRKIAVEFDNAEYFLLWTKPEAKYICLEPWCGVQDIMGSDYDISNKEGIIRLEKSQKHSFVHSIEIMS